MLHMVPLPVPGRSLIVSTYLPTIKQLQYLVALHEHGHFGRAAEAMFVSQSTLSAGIRELESLLGVTLVERSRRVVRFTPLGNAVVAKAHRLLREAEELSDLVQASGKPLAGELRMSVIPTIAPYLVPAATGAVRHAFPKLTMAWIEDKTSTLVSQMSAGDIDAAVLALEADIGDLEHALIASDPFVLVAPPGHPLLAKSGPIPAKELRAADILLLDEGHCMREQALEVCTSVKAREGEFRATSLSTLVQLVVQGAGVTLLPALALLGDQAAWGDLKAPRWWSALALVACAYYLLPWLDFAYNRGGGLLSRHVYSGAYLYGLALVGGALIVCGVVLVRADEVRHPKPGATRTIARSEAAAD